MATATMGCFWCVARFFLLLLLIPLLLFIWMHIMNGIMCDFSTILSANRVENGSNANHFYVSISCSYHMDLIFFVLLLVFFTIHLRFAFEVNRKVVARSFVAKKEWKRNPSFSGGHSNRRSKCFVRAQFTKN